jgi:hypothetical protein
MRSGGWKEAAGLRERVVKIIEAFSDSTLHGLAAELLELALQLLVISGSVLLPIQSSRAIKCRPNEAGMRGARR